MTLRTKQIIIAVLSLAFLGSLIFVQYLEVAQKEIEAGLREPHISIPATSKQCVDCHVQSSPGIIDHWKGSRHAEKGVGCFDCHKATAEDADSYKHYGAVIATVVTPLDCSECHPTEAAEFAASHHAKGGNILASLDNFLAETVEGARVPFNPHSTQAGTVPDLDKGNGATFMVNGMASVNVGCKQCHGSVVALEAKDGSLITVKELDPDENGKPKNQDLLKKRNMVPGSDDNLRPVYAAATWPNTGIGRINLDGSKGSCSACHSRHDFSPRRARQPENCGKCHLGPDHPQKEIYEESKHGVAFRDLKEHMNLDAVEWVLGDDYTQAPTCATCHMSGHTRNDGKVTHDPGERISWTNRPYISFLMDTDEQNQVVKETDPLERSKLVTDTWEQKRARMKEVCTHCHTANYVRAFYEQYDDFVVNYNEKFGKPGNAIVTALRDNGLITKTQFDEEIEWTWFYLWHHEGRRARHGASMMAPDYAHWHGMYEVAERFYMELVPQAREICEHAKSEGKTEAAATALAVINEIVSRPEHEWFEAEKHKSATQEAATPDAVESGAAAGEEPAPAGATAEPPEEDGAPAGRAEEGDATTTDASADGAAESGTTAAEEEE